MPGGVWAGISFEFLFRLRGTWAVQLAYGPQGAGGGGRCHGARPRCPLRHTSTGSSCFCGLGSKLGCLQSSSIHPAMGDHGQTFLTAVGDMGRGGGPATRAPHIEVRGLVSKRMDAMPGSSRPALPQLLYEGKLLSFIHADHHKNTTALPSRAQPAQDPDAWHLQLPLSQSAAVTKERCPAAWGSSGTGMGPQGARDTARKPWGSAGGAGGTCGAGAGRGGSEHPTRLLQEAEVIKAGWGLWEMQTQGLQ